MSDTSVWLGVPGKEAPACAIDAYVTKVGGKALLLRAPAAADRSCPATFKCPKCRSAQHVSPLAQLYAPLECYDRVLYILTCAACGTLPGPRTEGAAMATAPPMPPTANPGAKKGPGAAAAAAASSRTSCCFAVRSQNFSLAYYGQSVEEQRRVAAAAARDRAAAAGAKKGAGGLLFQEADDWGGGDDWGSESGSDHGEADKGGEETAAEPTEVEHGPLPQLREVFPLAAKGATAAVGGRVYTTGLPLSLYVEPERLAERFGSVEEQLAEAQWRYGVDAGTLDTTSFEDDDETPLERVVREYVERVEESPTQCVRWCPGGKPLRAAVMPSLQTVPCCPACRAPRRFECQLTAPVVYYLTKGIGESNNAAVHFSNVFVFTCSGNCYGPDAYLSEHVVVEDEI